MRGENPSHLFTHEHSLAILAPVVEEMVLGSSGMEVPSGQAGVGGGAGAACFLA